MQMTAGEPCLALITNAKGIEPTDVAHLPGAANELDVDEDCEPFPEILSLPRIVRKAAKDAMSMIRTMAMGSRNPDGIRVS